MAKSKRKGRKVHTGIKKRNEREREGSIERERDREKGRESEMQRTNNSGLTRENILSLAIERESNRREDVTE